MTRFIGNSPIRSPAGGTAAAVAALAAALLLTPPAAARDAFGDSPSAVAQSPAQSPAPLPDQRDVNRFLHPEPPKYDNPVDKRIREAIRKLGLPPQPDLGGQGGGQQTPAEAPGLSATVLPRLDRNGDGFVSPSEYLGGRMPPRVAGSESSRRRLEEYRRYNARFRAADRNGDGRLSPAEIDAMQGRPF